jgi:hypothetical protein
MAMLGWDFLFMKPCFTGEKASCRFAMLIVTLVTQDVIDAALLKLLCSVLRLRSLLRLEAPLSMTD